MSEYTLELGGPIYATESIGVQGPAGADGDGAGGGGSSTYLGLSDTPASFTADRLVAVNGTGDSLIHPTAAPGPALLALGTAALSAAGDFATAAQGVLAGTAVQPADLADVATSGDYGDLINLPIAPARGRISPEFRRPSHPPRFYPPGVRDLRRLGDRPSGDDRRRRRRDPNAPQRLRRLRPTQRSPTRSPTSSVPLPLADTLAEIADAINDDASLRGNDQRGARQPAPPGRRRRLHLSQQGRPIEPRPGSAARHR